MHPAFLWWHNHARRHGHHDEQAAPCGPGWGFMGGDDRRGGPHHGPGHHPGHHHGPHGGHRGGDDDGFPGGGGGPFGVRRPLRFLAHKLDLSEAQVSDLARILDELKTERAQADVDHRRTVAAFADAMEGATFGEGRAREGGEQRVKSAERLRDAVTKALSQIHGLLEDDQRKQMAYMIRTGVLSL